MNAGERRAAALSEKTMDRSTVEYWRHVADVRQMMKNRPPSEQGRAARFNERYWALDRAAEEIRGRKPIASESYREHVGDVLKGLQEEIGAEFAAWREARGIPDL